MLVVFLLAPALILLIGLFRGEYSLVVDLFRITCLSGLFLLSFSGWGSLLFRHQDSQQNKAELWVVRLITGAGILYVVYLFLAILRIFRPAPVVFLVTAGAALGLFRLLSDRPRLRTSEWPLIDKLLLGSVLLLAGVRIVCSWTPLISYDSLVYQFFTPAQYLSHGGFVYIPWNVYTNSPMALQLTLGASLTMDPSGATFKMLLTITSLSMPLAVALFLIDWNRTAALIASLFTLAYPAFWTPDTLGTIDLTVAGFLLLGIHWLRKALIAENSSVSVLASGIALGLGLASRDQAIPILVPALFLVSLEKRAEDRVSPGLFRLRVVSLCTAIIILLTLPWVIKNWVFTGNPVFPALYEQLGGIDWSADQARRLNYDVFGAPLSAFAGIHKFLAPIQLLLVQPYNAILGIFVLLCSIPALLMYSKRAYGLAAVGGCIALLGWGLIHPVADVRLFRFNAAGILFLMIASAGYCVEKFKRAGALVAIFAALASLPFGLSLLLHVFPVYATVTDGQFRKNFQIANVPGWPAIENANTILDRNRNKLLLLGETRGFLLHVPCVCPSAFNSPQVAELFQPMDSPDAWRSNFKHHGISHILISMKEWDNLQSMKYYGYMNLPRQDQIKIIRWLQDQKVLFEDRAGNALLEVNYDNR